MRAGQAAGRAEGVKLLPSSARGMGVTFHYCKPWMPFGCMAAEGTTASKVVFGLAGLAIGVMLGLVLFALILLPAARRVLEPASTARFERVGFRIGIFGALLLSVAAAAGMLVFGAWLAALLAIAAFAVLLYAGFGLGAGRVEGGAVAATALALVFGVASWGFLVW